jgi:small subunit ribosomal protein S16
MVKIRLRRIGTKGRPYYRVVVAPSTAGRNGRFVETIGTYDPVAQPKHIEIKEDRALHWLRHGAQPTETTAYLLNKTGILGKFFEERPEAKGEYKFLDKRTASMSKQSAVTVAAPAAAETKAEPKAEAPAPVAEAPAEEAAAPEATVEEAPAAEAEAAAEPAESTEEAQ